MEVIAVNTTDVKIRAKLIPSKGTVRILGYNGIGIVIAKGHEVVNFEIGDKFFYAGAINHAGTYAEYNAVDHAL